jgi:transglutaminase-like putative cysteine protease
LYPNQYVNFTEDSQAVKLAASLSDSAESDLDFLTEVYHYVVEHVTYDEDKAQNVELGYLPDIDETLSTGKGICFDYAALMTAMLRSQGIPCKMAVGYSNEVKHSWVDVFIEGSGWIDHAIELDSDEWKLLDPTFASSNPDDDTVKDYIGDGSNYILQYNE